jgi:leucyl aminopeptidase
VKLSVTSAPTASVAAQVLVIAVFETPGGPVADPAVVRPDIGDLLARSRFAGKEADSLLVAVQAGQPFDAVLLAGMGRPDDMDLAGVRRMAARTVRSLSRFDSIAIAVPAGLTRPGDDAAMAGAVADGALDGWYRRASRKSSPAEPWSITDLTVVVGAGDEQAARAAVADAEIIATCVSWARELIDAPAGEMTPAGLADAALAMSSSAGLDARIRYADELREQGFCGILAVGGGSASQPCLIEVRHPGTSGTTIGLAGKGITFDSGGLFLKSGPAMADMKSDMAGAATMLATARAAAMLGCPTGVLAVAPAAENMPSGYSYRPGDIIRHRGGRTSEVSDTDAEGRVVLADALAYLAEQRPAAIVDAATLTYDVIKALGDQIGGVLGTDDTLVAEIIAAGRHTGEPWWQLPLWRGYRANIDSPVADVRNDGGPFADAIHAALFLAEFTADVPWAHLDIAGTAFRERDTQYGPAGATGAGIRTLVHWLRTRTVRSGS